MYKKYYFLFLFFVNSVSVYSQSNESSVYISVHSGVFITSNDNFDKIYNSRTGIVYGFGLGLPLSTRSYIYGKASIFSKSGKPVIQTYSFVDGNLVLISETQEGSSSFTQWIINVGFMYNFFLNPHWTLGLNGGITYTKFSEKRKYTNGNISLSADASGILGFFIGGVLEKNFGKNPFALFIEPQYNFARNNILGYINNYGGYNFNIGVKYYFGQRRLE